MGLWYYREASLAEGSIEENLVGLPVAEVVLEKVQNPSNLLLPFELHLQELKKSTQIKRNCEETFSFLANYLLFNLFKKSQIINFHIFLKIGSYFRIIFSVPFAA